MNPESKILFPYYFYGQIVSDPNNNANICLLNLDTTPLFYSEYYLADWVVKNDMYKAVRQQDGWVRESYPILNKCNFILSLGHHNYYSPASRTGKKGWWYFMEKFIIGKSDILVTGHEHIMGFWKKTPVIIKIRENKPMENGLPTIKTFTFREPKNTPQIIVGSSGRLWGPGDTDHDLKRDLSSGSILQKNGYLKVTYNLSNNTAKFELISLEGNNRSIFKSFLLEGKRTNRFGSK